MNYLEEVQNIKDELIRVREEIHRHPELGNQEFKTAALVEQFLQDCGIETERMLDTAVVGTLKGGKPGKTAALRADMDALPVTETSGAAFASEEPGKMHACGHDVHTTAVLGAAKLLAKNRDNLSGTVKFFFQPDEETFGGAERMIKAGCMGDTSAVFGAHVDPDIPEGAVGIRYGKFYAAADILDIVVHGKSAHGATPEKGINALMCACEMILNMKDLAKNTVSDPCVLTFGKLEGGTARNVVAEKACFSGILRALGREDIEKMRDAITKVVNETASKYGATAEIIMHGHYDGIVNTDEGSLLAEQAVKQLLGEDKAVIIEQPKMITEDFGCFVYASSGAFYHIGAGCSLPLHNSAFLPTTGAMLTAAAVHAEVITTYMNG